ncbi:hypothetical protein REPUB_Repub17cG0188000 [Reevesia pubescens]
MGLSPIVTICNTLINGNVKARDVDQANMLYQEMRLKGKTFNILVAGHFKYGQEEDGDRLLRELSAVNLLPDHSLCDISVVGLCWAGCLDETMEFLENMLEKGMTPSIVAFNSIIAAYSRAGLEDDAYKAGLVPDIVTYNTLIGGYYEAFDMVKVGQFMNNMYCSPDTVTYNTGQYRDILNRAMIITAKLIKIAFIPNVITINVLLSHFCKQGMSKRALLWCQKLSEIPFDFDEVSYKIMDQAYRSIQEDVEFFRATSEKAS